MTATNTLFHPESFKPTRHKKNRVLDLPVERYDHRKGLNSLQVHMTVFSDDGRLWAATPTGLACFNGVSLQVFGRKDGLVNHGLRTLAIHPKTGNLWLGTDTGIEVLDIHKGRPKSLWASPIGTVNALGLHEDVALIGSSMGLFIKIDENDIKPLTGFPEANDTIGKILPVNGEGFWVIGSSTGLFRLTHDFIKLKTDSIQVHIGSPNTLAEGPDGGILVGGARGICHLTQDGKILSTRALSAPVEALLWDREKIWLALDQSLMSLTQDLQDPMPPKFHMKGVVIHHILGDRFENLWLATSGQALLKVSNFRNTFVEDFPTETGHVLSIFSDKSGRLIGGSTGLVLPNGNVILNNLEVWDVLKDAYGKVWCATDKGLFCTPNPSLSFKYRHEDCRIISAPCRALIIFKNCLYIASIRGLARVKASGVEEVFDPQGDSFGYVYSLHIGPDGNLWIATLGRGVFFYDGDTMKPVEIIDMASNANVYAITHDRTGNLYLAHDNRITRRDREKNSETLYESTTSVAAWCLGWMPGGNLITGSSSGLMILDDTSGKVRHRIYGNFEDIPWEFTTSRSLAVINQTRLYCGLGSGLRTVNPSDLISRNESPVPRLAKIECKGADSIVRDSSLEISPGKWRLTVHISTEWLLDACLMRYRLVGFDLDWSDYINPGPVHYTSLPEGHYDLEVELWSPVASHGPVTRLLNVIVSKNA